MELQISHYSIGWKNSCKYNIVITSQSNNNLNFCNKKITSFFCELLIIIKVD